MGFLYTVGRFSPPHGSISEVIHAHVPQEIVLVVAVFDIDRGLDIVDDVCLFAHVIVAEKCRVLLLVVMRGLLRKGKSLLEGCRGLFLVIAG